MNLAVIPLALSLLAGGTQCLTQAAQNQFIASAVACGDWEVAKSIAIAFKKGGSVAAHIILIPQVFSCTCVIANRSQELRSRSTIESAGAKTHIVTADGYEAHVYEFENAPMKFLVLTSD